MDTYDNSGGLDNPITVVRMHRKKKSGGRGTRTPMGLLPAVFKTAALPIRTSPPADLVYEHQARLVKAKDRRITPRLLLNPVFLLKLRVAHPNESTDDGGNNRRK